MPMNYWNALQTQAPSLLVSSHQKLLAIMHLALTTLYRPMDSRGAYSGVSLSSFQKHITIQEISKEGIKRLGPIVETMAEAENLIGHKNAISVRLKSLT